MKRKIIVTVCFLSVMTAVYYNHKNYRYFYPFNTTTSGLSYKAMCMGNERKVQEGEWVEVSYLLKVVHKQKTVQDKSKPEGKEGDKPATEDKEVGNPKSEGKEGDKPATEDKEVGKPEKQKKENKSERILIDSSISSQPLWIQFGDNLKNDNKVAAEMLSMVEEGQRTIFKCSPKYYFGQQYPEHLIDLFLNSIGISADDELIADIRIKKIITNEERTQMIQTQYMAQLETDKKLIIDYLAAHKISASTTQSGLFYVIDESYQGVAIVPNKKVKVHYIGKLLNGNIFDTSLEKVAKDNNVYNPKRKYETIELEVAKRQVIAGLDEGLLLLKKGEKARFFIPSGLAYGETNQGDIIPANSILLFEVEVVDVF